jgi:hypothetical protein
VPRVDFPFDGGSGTDSISFINLPGSNTATLASGNSVQIAYGATLDMIGYTSDDTLALNQGAGANTLFEYVSDDIAGDHARRSTAAAPPDARPRCVGSQQHNRERPRLVEPSAWRTRINRSIN